MGCGEVCTVVCLGCCFVPMVLAFAAGLLASLGYAFYDDWEAGLVYTGCLLLYALCLKEWKCCGGPGPFPDGPPNPSHHSGRSLAVCSCLATLGSIGMVVQWRYPTVRALGLGVCTASGYGILNDMLACHLYCVEYFSNGHTDFHVRLIGSNSPTLNALVWGCYATWMLGLPFGLVISYVARTPALSQPVDFWILAVCAGSIALVALIHCELAARRELAKYPACAGGTGPGEEPSESLQDMFSQTIHSQTGYEDVNMRLVPEQSRAGWMATGARNGAAYTVMPVGGLLLALGVLLVRSIWTIVDKFNDKCDANMWGAMCGGSGWAAGWLVYFIVATVGLPLGVAGLIMLVTLLNEASMGRRHEGGSKRHRGDREMDAPELWQRERYLQAELAAVNTRISCHQRVLASLAGPLPTMGSEHVLTDAVSYGATSREPSPDQLQTCDDRAAELVWQLAVLETADEEMAEIESGLAELASAGYLTVRAEMLEEQLAGGLADQEEQKRRLEEELAAVAARIRELESPPEEAQPKLSQEHSALDLAVPAGLVQRAKVQAWSDGLRRLFLQQNGEARFLAALNQTAGGMIMVRWLVAHSNTAAGSFMQWRRNAGKAAGLFRPTGQTVSKLVRAKTIP